MRIGSAVLLFVPLLVALLTAAIPPILTSFHLSRGLTSSEHSSATHGFVEPSNPTDNLNRSQALRLLKRNTQAGKPNGATPRKPHAERQLKLEKMISENALKSASELAGTDHAATILYYLNTMPKDGVDSAVHSTGVLKAILRGGTLASPEVKAKVIHLAVNEGLGHPVLGAHNIGKIIDKLSTLE